MALQVGPYEYDLVLQPDINTRGHTQWFFFAVSNTRAGRPYRLNLINLLKEDSLYNSGMLPLMHSERQMRTKVRRAPWWCYGSTASYCSYCSRVCTVLWFNAHGVSWACEQRHAP